MDAFAAIITICHHQLQMSQSVLNYLSMLTNLYASQADDVNTQISMLTAGIAAYRAHQARFGTTEEQFICKQTLDIIAQRKNEHIREVLAATAASGIVDVSEAIPRTLSFSIGIFDTFRTDSVRFKHNFLFSIAEFLWLVDKLKDTWTLPRDTVKKIARRELCLREVLRKPPRRRRHRLCLYDRILMVLWQLRGNIKYSILQSMTKVDRSTCCREVRHGLRVIRLVLVPYSIRWPTYEERQRLSSIVPVLQGCIGFVDGTECIWKKTDPAFYSGKQKTHTLLHQITCDWQGRIRHVVAGEAGSVTDRLLFMRSSLFQKRHKMFDGKQYVLGDGGYSGAGPIVTPISKPNDFEMKFNAFLSYHRAIVEQTIGRVKVYFGFAANQPNGDSENAVNAFFSACALYNIYCEFNSFPRSENYLNGLIEDWEYRDLSDIELTFSNNFALNNS